MQNLAAIVVLLLAVNMTSAAQTRGMTDHSPARPNSRGMPVRGITSVPRFGERHFGPHHARRFFGPGILYPGFYDYDSEPVVVEQQPSPVVVVNPSPAEKPEPPHAVEPLMLERQGDRWVRVGQGTMGTPGAGSSSSKERRASAKQPQESQRPPAVLVFRDHHREEVSGYTIMQGALYASQDYWTTGSWTKKVLLADLDLPETIRANQERGVKFVLPSAPNEVVVRP
jgi:hypothetical protein